VCEKVIEIEEQEALPDGTIPEHARIFEMDLRLHEEKGGHMTYKRRWRSEDGSESIEAIQENLNW
jgi:hypothetical protein